MNLHPGDLCVIIDGLMRQRDRYLIGRTVVLLHIVDVDAPLAPYWRCSGIPPHVIVSHQILRRIPPEKMLDARTHITKEEDPCPAESMS